MHRHLILRSAALLLAAAAVIALAMALWDRRPRLSEDETRSLIMTTLQREAREAFIVTGSLELAATSRVRTTRRMLPGLLDITVGSVETIVRLPGRVSYGIDVGALGEDAIRVRGDTIEIRVPDPRIYSVEPMLEAMDVQTESGWLRMPRDMREDVQQRAITGVLPALRAQAERHLTDSDQPRVNTAETLHELLLPTFRAAGFTGPVFRFIITDELVYRGGGGERRN
jgi:hypothetical protein